MNETPASLNRRDFITLSSSSIILAASGLSFSAEKPWYETMRRCGQINFNERDPLTFDVKAWADYWASLKVNAVLLNGGGIVAFYPTRIPYHHRSEFLGERDLFGEMVAAIKKRGMRVVSRMDCNYAYEEALKAHPEWFERNRDGAPRRHSESTWLFKTCMFSPYFTDQMPSIYREINRLYPVDGFFTNGWPSTGGLGVCYCENCRKVYDEQVGGTPPEQTDVSNPLYRKYYEVYMARVLEIWRLWDAVAKENKRDSIYVGNLGGGIRTVKDVKRLGDVAGWFNADHQGRSGDTPIWDCAQQGRVAQSVMQGRTITNVTGAYSNSRIVWRHTSKPAPETTLWMAQTVASGMVPWFHWLGGSPEDNRWREVGRSFFDWLSANEAHFRNKRSLADLAVLYPQNTIAFYKMNPGRGGERSETVDYLQGLYYALLEGRFPFDFVHQENLSLPALKRYRALLIPNAALLRDRECGQIRDYVKQGGSVLATFETSRYNEWGDARKDFGLAEVFGASIAGEVVGPYGNSYARIERPHPVTSGFEDTALLPGAENRLPVRPKENLPLVLSVVPYYPAFPPEMVFPRTPRTEEPAAIFRVDGNSRIAYFSGDIERSFWRSGNTDLLRLIVNAVRWTLGDRQPALTAEGEGIVELFAWETEVGYSLHVLNYTNPNMTRGFIHHLYPIGPQKISISVPGSKISSVQALRLKRSLVFKQSGPVVQFEIPTVMDYEVVALT
ncbi:MAG TPA: alpha-amylase family protein [Acidobacteriota bacterium]|nr:alpha-amylase family protein [Acidobacteriota bacterium]